MTLTPILLAHKRYPTTMSSINGARKVLNWKETDSIEDLDSIRHNANILFEKLDYPPDIFMLFRVAIVS